MVKKTLMTTCLVVGIVLIFCGCDLFAILSGEETTDDNNQDQEETYFYVGGYVTDASTETYVEDVRYVVREGSENRDGGVVISSGLTEINTVPATTSFLTVLEPGTYTIQFSKDDYHVAYLLNVVVADHINDANIELRNTDTDWGTDFEFDCYHTPLE